MPELPDRTGAEESVSGPDQSGSLLSQISTEMVRAMKQYYGKGPVQAKSYFVDDLLFIVMRGGVTQAEQTMLDAGHEDTVRQFRQEFENEMAQRLTYMVEQISGRRVLTYQSQILFDPNLSVEIFVFDHDAGPREREETAEAVRDNTSLIGLARADEVEDPDWPPEKSSP